jgi:peptidoglycan/xylan/chitin deacetylase (PgdA/CDA1 family)
MKWRQGRLFWVLVQIIFVALYGKKVIPAYLTPAPLLLGLVWAIWASANICSQVFLPAICRIPSKHGILITFDDGPHPVYTPQILSTLQKHGVKAVFFLIGQKAAQHPEVVKKIIEEGHLLGNHSYRHNFSFSLQKVKSLHRDIELCDQTLERITGQKIWLFRPPYGVTNPSLAKALNKFPQYRVIGWSVRSLDTVSSRENVLLARLATHVQNGDIVLLHDRCAITAGSLEKLLEGLRKKGLSFADPSVLIADSI